MNQEMPNMKCFENIVRNGEHGNFSQCHLLKEIKSLKKKICVVSSSASHVLNG